MTAIKTVEYGFISPIIPSGLTTLDCMVRLSITVVMLFIALLASLCLKKLWSSLIICLFLFMAKGLYLFCLHLQYSDNQ